MNGYFYDFYHSESAYTVVIEDDERVCYAYLLNTEAEIVSDCWIYNRIEAPTEDTWLEKSDLPYLNSYNFTLAKLPYDLPSAIEDWKIEWNLSGQRAQLFICGTLAGILVEGEKPGWSAAAKRTGPLAKQL